MPYPEELVNSALENVAEAADSLPKAELNPLINPVLGRNLGRWAQVYFTSPPERREEAVGELLRELQREGPGEPIAPVPPGVRKGKSEPVDGSTQQLLCPVCQRLNHIGQRFCGYCRLPLTPEAERDSRDDPDKSNQPDTSPNTVSGDDELEWLRDKALSSFDEPQAPARRGFMYLVVGILILAAAFAYLQWASSQPGSPAQPSAVSAPSTALQPPAQVSDVSQPKVPKERQPAAVSSKAPDTSTGRSKLSEAGLRSEPSQQAGLPE
ncbi:MAG TPA: zinc ribbon domain-containing protein, partial [Terriglobales bacterium]|nr:zinc ribbon domain-containing protein [Terriglobales bacterium]